MRIIDRSFYCRDTVDVAKDLLGKKIVRFLNNQKLSGIITETEAYCFENDQASHAYNGKTPRNLPMFGKVGCVYIYFIYGNHFCFNIVAKQKNVSAGAVLVRAIKPVDGIENMKINRKKQDENILANGPGKLTQALCITKNENFYDLTKKGSLYICEGIEVCKNQIIVTPRIGISVAQDKPWRFMIKTRNL